MPSLMKSKVKSSRWDLPAGLTVAAVALLALLLMPGSATASPITLDGMFDGPDSYEYSVTVKWFNGHKSAPDSIYGDINNQLGTTTIHYGENELAGTNYFFLYVEVPLYAKNMIWQNIDWKNDYPVSNTNPTLGLTEEDVESYRVQHETHHPEGDMKLDFGGATGSEKLVLNNSSGKQFEASLAGDVKNDDTADPNDQFGFIAFKDSVDYLFDNSLATEALSLARNTKMSFEFQFVLDSAKNEALITLFDNGIEFHLSPERGSPVPIPGAVYLLGSGLIGLAGIRRKFRK